MIAMIIAMIAIVFAMTDMYPIGDNYYHISLNYTL